MVKISQCLTAISRVDVRRLLTHSSTPTIYNVTLLALFLYPRGLHLSIHLFCRKKPNFMPGSQVLTRYSMMPSNFIFIYLRAPWHHCWAKLSTKNNRKTLNCHDMKDIFYWHSSAPKVKMSSLHSRCLIIYFKEFYKPFGFNESIILSSPHLQDLPISTCILWGVMSFAVASSWRWHFWSC